MKYYTKHQVEEVKKMDLLTYLKNYEPNELITINKDNYALKEHDSLKISNGKWYWFSKGFGGYTALDFLIRVRGYSFIQAMETIIHHTKIFIPVDYKVEKDDKKVNFILPEKECNNDIVINYLLSRGIDKDLIMECIDKGLLFEEKNTHNVVFLGLDKNNEPRYAGLRGSGKTRFMKEAYGSHKAFSFKLEPIESSDVVHLFESAIDLLSYATIQKIKGVEWYKDGLLSLAGVYQPAKDIVESKLPLALNYYLNQHQNVNKIILHLDNDQAGRTSTMGLKFAIPKHIEVVDDPPKYGKDFNDFLCVELGIRNKNISGKER